ncbi:MAG: DUF1822 family protein [Coleofasciculus sp. S288]|nr:DUF1822 family protein [Coleofasciculus sp. S288]
MNNAQTPLLTISLGGEAHRFARQFAAQQATPQKGKRVYFNTLAVYAVHSYLKCLQIETSLRQSDCWHPGKRAVLDVADLALPDIGKLECRPIPTGETACPLPPEVTENRIGYVGVQFGESLSEVQLLGFSPAVDADNPPEQLQITDLQPLDALIDHIHQLKVKMAIASEGINNVSSPQTIGADAVPVRADATSPSQTIMNLSRWLDNIFDGGWQSLDAFLGTANSAWSFRSVIHVADNRLAYPEKIIRGIKLIDLGIQLAGHPVALVVTLIPETDQKTNLILQVHPAAGRTYLPQHTRLTVFDEYGATFLEAQARSADNFIQLQFSGRRGERFSIQVALGVASITEDFAI